MKITAFTNFGHVVWFMECKIPILLWFCRYIYVNFACLTLLYTSLVTSAIWWSLQMHLDGLGCRNFLQQQSIAVTMFTARRSLKNLYSLPTRYIYVVDYFSENKQWPFLERTLGRRDNSLYSVYLKCMDQLQEVRRRRWSGFEMLRHKFIDNLRPRTCLYIMSRGLSVTKL